MRRIGRDLAELREGLTAPVERTRQMARRATAGPALVRGGLYATGFVALATALPADLVLGRVLPAIAVIALVPVLFPRGAMPTVVILLAIGGWIADTTMYGGTPTYLRLVILASAVYLLHTLAALAAVLPYDAVVAGDVLGRWLLRAALVIVLTAGLGLFVVVVPGQFGGGRYLVASIVGLGLMIGLAAYLASLARRR